MYQLIISLVFSALAFVVVLPAFAFVPDDEELSSSMQKNYGALTSWEAEMTFPQYPGVSAHIWYARGNWRQEWKAGDKAVAVGNGANVSASCTAEEFALSPLFVWMVPNPVEAWKSWGVDNATRTYGFCGDQPCLSFGAEPDDETLAAVQMNNEDFSPILIRYISDKGVTSVAYSDYRTLGGFQVPQKVLLTVGAMVLEADVKWTAVNRADSEELYDRSAIDGTPCAMPPAPFDVLREAFRYPSTQ